MRKFWRAAEATVADIEKLSERPDLRFDYSHIEGTVRPGKCFGLRYSVGQRFCGPLQIRTLVLERIRNREQNAAETGAAHLVFGRKIRAAKKRTAIGEQESR